MLTISSSEDSDIIFVTVSGQIEHQDYELRLLPAIAAKLQQYASIRMCYEFSAEFTGISMAALWDDALLGLFHLSDFSRVVMLVELETCRATVQVLASMLPCPVKIFAVHDRVDALDWLTASAS